MQFQIFDIEIDSRLVSVPAAQAENLVRLVATQVSEQAFNRRRKNALRETDVIVFRLDVSIDWSKHPEIRDLFEYLLGERKDRNPINSQILIWSSDFQIDHSVINDPQVNLSSAKADILASVKKSEMYGYVNAADALFSHGQSALFGLPSGRFSDYFFRTGNLQTNLNFIRGSFFWSIPHLKDATQIISDTWSISTTAATYTSLLENYTVNTKAIEWNYLIEYLPGSKESRNLLKQLLSNEFGELGSGDVKRKVVFLCSYSGSGRLRNEVVAISGDHCDRSQFVFLALFAPSEADSAEENCFVLCNISELIERLGLTGRQPSTVSPEISVFDVNPASYFPDYQIPQEEKFLVGDAKGKAFFERYAAQGIFSVFRSGRSPLHFSDSPSDTKGRHHAFHIDAKKLFQSNGFRANVSARVEQAPSAPIEDAVLLEDREASWELLNSYLLAKGASAENIDKIIVPSIASIDNDDGLRSLFRDGGGRRLLVVIPMVITGRTLGDFQIMRRKLKDELGCIAPDIHIIVGVLRPDEEQKIIQIEKYYLNELSSERSGSVTSTIFESVLLPNWQEQQCPWMRELRNLAKVLRTADLDSHDRAFLSRRRRLLLSRQHFGLRGIEVFSARDPRRLSFNSGSRFLDTDAAWNAFGSLSREDVSEADLCCAVASAMQYWRQRGKQSSIPLKTIDTSTIANHNGFNESRLRACLWRSLQRHELISSSRRGSDFRTMIERIFDLGSQEANYTDLEIEALLAFGRELPRVLNTSSEEWNWHSTKVFASYR